jgi:hypothetical protein
MYSVRWFELTACIYRIGQNHICTVYGDLNWQRCIYRLARTTYVRCICGDSGREITKYKVMYGVYIRFWRTLYIFTVLANPSAFHCLATVCHTKRCVQSTLLSLPHNISTHDIATHDIATHNFATHDIATRYCHTILPHTILPHDICIYTPNARTSFLKHLQAAFFHSVWLTAGKLLASHLNT